MIMVDTFEPKQIEELIAQSVQVQRMGLNPQGIADYMWYACDGHRVQVERKQTGELLASLDNVEEQLQRELSNGVDETILLIEGVCQPVFGLKLATQIWHKAKDKNIMVPGRTFNCSYTGYKAWQNQLEKAGVTIVETFDYIATAMTLIALFQNSQKKEHTTLRRYIKDKIYIESKNPHIISLMGIKGGGIGEEKAKALIDRYGTFWYVLSRPAEELAETIVGDAETGKRLGLKAVNKLFSAIGR
jgi:ERCC4-type nuclease